MKRLSLIAALMMLTALASAQDYKNWASGAPRLPDEFFATDSARSVSGRVMRAQLPTGAWPKNINFFRLDSIAPGINDGTIDNGATMTEIRFLARLYEATGDTACLSAVERGISYLLEMQYDNGGFPQYYPRHDHYHGRITYNDDAMISALSLLLAVSRREPPYAHLRPDFALHSLQAVDRGIECILQTQYRQGDTLTIWAQQYDEKTLLPAPARAFELEGLCSAESVPIVEFLQKVAPTHPEVQPAIDAALRWFRAHRLPDGRWARFYTLEDNRPFFCGRDGVMRFALEEIDQERQRGYSWYNRRPERLLKE